MMILKKKNLMTVKGYKIYAYSLRASGRFNQVVEAKRFDGMF